MNGESFHVPCNCLYIFKRLKCFHFTENSLLCCCVEIGSKLRIPAGVYCLIPR
jgi:hypothetical protein